MAVNEAGEVEATFKLKAVGKSSKTATLGHNLHLDASGKPAEIKEHGGSEGKVSYNIVPWYTAMLGASVSLRLEGVQILKLVTGGGETVSPMDLLKKTVTNM